MRCEPITLLRFSIANKRFFNLIRSDYPLGIWRSFFFKTLQIPFDLQHQIQTNFSWFEIYLSLSRMCFSTCWLLIDNFLATQLIYSLYFVLWYENIRFKACWFILAFLHLCSLDREIAFAPAYISCRSCPSDSAASWEWLHNRECEILSLDY